MSLKTNSKWNAAKTLLRSMEKVEEVDDTVRQLGSKLLNKANHIRDVAVYTAKTFDENYEISKRVADKATALQKEFESKLEEVKKEPSKVDLEAKIELRPLTSEDIATYFARLFAADGLPAQVTRIENLVFLAYVEVYSREKTKLFREPYFVTSKGPVENNLHDIVTSYKSGVFEGNFFKTDIIIPPKFQTILISIYNQERYTLTADLQKKVTTHPLCIISRIGVTDDDLRSPLKLLGLDSVD